MMLFMFFRCEKVIDNLSIYRSMRGIKLKIIHGAINSPNRLGASNNLLLRPKMEGFDIDSLPIIKSLLQLIIDTFRHHLID